jgi:GNAT superfamily N-acetyltransferase
MRYLIEDVHKDEPLVRLFNAERDWAAYGYCDLEEPYRKHSRYIGAWGDDVLRGAILVFSPPGFTSLITFGNTEAADEILQHARDLPARGVFQARLEDVPALRHRFHIGTEFDMRRMVVESGRVEPGTSSYASIRAISPADSTAVRELYDLWDEVHFDPLMLVAGTYFGAFYQGELIAISGTHAISRRHGMATIGGVFTHPEHRGHGLAGATTSHVVARLHEVGVSDVALNVKADNMPALQAYERIGFRSSMEFVEGSLGTNAQEIES